jgi:MFS family permease
MTKPKELVPPLAKTSIFFYGYIVALAAFCIFFASFGIRFSYGVFFTPMSTELGWNSATTALAFSISALMEGIFNIVLGGMTDKYGPRIILTACGLIMGLGYCLMPLVNSAWQFFLFYGLFVGIGMGGVFAPLITIVARWFKLRRSLMSGLVICGNSLGMLVVSPLATQLIVSHGWRNTFLVLGMALTVIIVIAAQFLKRDPSTLGLLPDGKKIGSGQEEHLLVSGFTFKEALRSYRIWLVFIIFFALGFYVVGNQIFLVPDAIHSGMNSASAAYILSTLGGANILGLIVFGAMGDKIGNRRMFIFGYILYLLASAVILTHNMGVSFFIFAIMAGLAGGGMASSMSPLVASLFGLKSHGVIFGLCGFGCTIGQAAGPYIVGWIFDSTQNYTSALSVCAVIALLGLVLTLVLKPMKNSKQGAFRL